MLEFNAMSTTNIYVLRLQGGNFYIGKSSHVMERYQEHLNGYGSSWTKKYKPVGVDKIIEKVSPFEEDKITKEYMSKYGIEKVRGGTYVQDRLDDVQIEALKREIWGAKDLCTTCGRKGHFAADCHARTDVDGERLEDSHYDSVWVCEKCDKQFTVKSECARHERQCISSPSRNQNGSNRCYRCGRTGHYATDCYASTDSRGRELDDDDSDSGYDDSDEEDEEDDEDDEDDWDYDSE